MRRKLLLGLWLMGVMLLFTSCQCRHEWQEATCTKAKTCKLCGEEEGAALGHDWQEATCERPKICKRCSMTGGGRKEHDWQEATCTEPKTCKVCAATEGRPSAHTVEEWKLVSASTCEVKGIEEGICSVCQQTVTRELEVAAHTEGDWEVTKEATEDSKGERSIKCKVCGTVFKTETFELTAEEIEANYKADCVNYPYDKIARSPEEYTGKRARYYGKVLQVMQEKTARYIYYTLRIGTGGGYYYDKIIYCTYTAPASDPRILEDDMITIYGELMGEYTYQTVMGNEITLPYMKIKYVN